MQKINNIIVTIHHLTKKYSKGAHPAVNDLCLSMNEGEFLGLLGPNGAGKTTTISILCGLLRPTRGTVKLFNRDIQRELRKIKPLIGIVPQAIALYESLTARENLEYFGRMYGLHGKRLNNRIAESLEITGLEKYADHRVSIYSGGMKRRVNLIAGLLHEPRIVFLDEPTVGIDVHSRRLIMDYLIDLNKKGTSVVYTTHYLEDAEKLCSRVIIIDEGNIIADGSPVDLISNNPSAVNLEKLFLSLTGNGLRD